MLPRYLIGIFVLAFIFSVACGAATKEILENNNEDGIVDLIDWLNRIDTENVNDGMLEQIIIKILKYLAQAATVNCIKKIIAACPPEIKTFLSCAFNYIKEHKLECAAPNYYKLQYSSGMNE